VLPPYRNSRARPQAAAGGQPIRARLSGEDFAEALGLTANSVIGLCRALLGAGHAPNLPLHAYRGSTLALIVTSIGEAATLRPGRIGFVRDQVAAKRTKPRRRRAFTNHAARGAP
jgi:hypothetical protein